MPTSLLYAQRESDDQWIPLACDVDGKLIIDPSEIFEADPTDNEHGKAPESDWAYDHANDENAHHTPRTDDEIRALMGLERWITPGEFAHSNCTLVPQNNFATINMRDGLTPQIWATVRVPAGATGIEKIELWYYCENDNNLYMLFRFSQVNFAIGEDIVNDETDGYSTYSGTATHLDKITVPAAAYNGITITENDLLGFHAIRAASDANDTYNDNLKVFGVRITFN